MILQEEKIINRNSIAQLIEGNIFHIHYLPETSSTIDDFKEGYESYQILGQGEKLKVLIEMGTLASVDTEAREFGEKNKIDAIAEAFVLYTLPQRLIFSMYLKFRQKNSPVKVFKNKTLAISWLNSING